MSVQKATRGIDPELAMWMAMTRRLPRVRGAGRILDLAKRIYTRKRRPPVVADVLGSRMILDPGEFVDRSLLFGPQFYDHFERQLVRERLHPGDVFVDVGAHIGLYSLVAAQALGPQGLVLAFEADPTNHARLVENLALNEVRNVRALHVGVADRAGTLSLGVNDWGNRGGNSFLLSRATSVEVHCDTLCSLIASQGVRVVAGMKLDVEGFEYKVLRRFFEEAPAEMHPRFMIVEHNPTLLHTAGGDALELLKRQGYVVDRAIELNYVLSFAGR
jgi:FkbM family methyltransferase